MHIQAISALQPKECLLVYHSHSYIIAEKMLLLYKKANTLKDNADGHQSVICCRSRESMNFVLMFCAQVLRCI